MPVPKKLGQVTCSLRPFIAFYIFLFSHFFHLSLIVYLHDEGKDKELLGGFLER